MFHYHCDGEIMRRTHFTLHKKNSSLNWSIKSSDKIWEQDKIVERRNKIPIRRKLKTESKVGAYSDKNWEFHVWGWGAHWIRVADSKRTRIKCQRPPRKN